MAIVKEIIGRPVTDLCIYYKGSGNAADDHEIVVISFKIEGREYSIGQSDYINETPKVVFTSHQG